MTFASDSYFSIVSEVPHSYFKGNLRDFISACVMDSSITGPALFSHAVAASATMDPETWDDV
jgi:hypothetical protein